MILELNALVARRQRVCQYLADSAMSLRGTKQILSAFNDIHGDIVTAQAFEKVKFYSSFSVAPTAPVVTTTGRGQACKRNEGVITQSYHCICASCLDPGPLLVKTTVGCSVRDFLAMEAMRR